jgi:hypothetical protein
MAYIQRIGFRHLHAIRMQVVATLGMTFKSMRRFDFRQWLEESAPRLLPAFDYATFGGLYVSHDHTDGPIEQNYAMIFNTCLLRFETLSADSDDEMKEWLRHSLKSSSASDHADEDYFGSELGGEWDPIGFIIRSGVILTLGVIEEFERGVLRILSSQVSQPSRLPTGLNFMPRLADYRRRPPAWKKLAGKAQTVRGRRELFSQFGISIETNAPWSDRLRAIRSDRNSIVHGAQALSPTFDVFLQLHYDVFAAMRHISSEILRSQRIVL